MFGIKGFAKGIAKAQLRSFTALKIRHPKRDRLDLYMMTMMLRPGYDQGRVFRIIQAANNVSKEADQQLNLRTLVTFMVIDEHSERAQKALTPGQMDSVEEAVSRVIPVGL